MPIQKPKSAPNGPCSVNDLLDLYDEMVVPHFQRGLVWEESSVSLLLESLYYGTPCGSIILWTPVSVSQEGESLGEKPRYLIVDGQQRIRSLRNVFRGSEDESMHGIRENDESDVDTENGDGKEDEEGNGVWCLNLGRVRELEQEFSGGKRFRIFRRASDPRKALKNVRGAPLRDREALLPLGWFLQHTDEKIESLVEMNGDAPLREASKAVLGNDVVKRRLRNILTSHRFHVSTLDATYKLEDVVGIYNRINSAGKRVESEEKAFANLVPAYPGVNRSLEEFFEAVHGSHKSVHGMKIPVELTRDNLLRRQKENRFGFKLFMRTLAQAIAYHSSRTIGASTFSFESVNQDSMRDERTRAHLPDIVCKTKDILVYLADVLRKELHCDDFRMLPETSSFWPLVQLIIRFPNVMGGGRGITASLALRLLLADKQKKDLLKLAAAVNEAQNLEEALRLFEKDKDLTRVKIQKTMNRRIKNADSIMNRYTLILYWLLRSGAAKDFRYDENTSFEKADELKKQFGGTEALLCDAVQAEKQHIVPYKRLKIAFNLEGKSRPGRHQVHNIGNLTYISHGLNSYKTGIGSEPLNLGREPPGNLKSHLLLDRSGNLLKAYNNACRYAELDSPQNDFNKAKRYFDAFSKKRRALITEAFLLWEDDIHRAGQPSASVEGRPVKRLIRPGTPDKIGDLGYPPDVEAVLVRLWTLRGIVKSRKLGAEISCGFRRKVSKKKKVQIVRIDLYRSPRKIEFKFGDVGLREWFETASPNIPFEDHKFNLDVDKPDAAEVVSMILEKLQKIGKGDA